MLLLGDFVVKSHRLHWISHVQNSPSLYCFSKQRRKIRNKNQSLWVHISVPEPCFQIKPFNINTIIDFLTFTYYAFHVHTCKIGLGARFLHYQLRVNAFEGQANLPNVFQYESEFNLFFQCQWSVKNLLSQALSSDSYE